MVRRRLNICLVVNIVDTPSSAEHTRWQLGGLCWNLFSGCLVLINHLIIAVGAAFEFARKRSQVHLIDVSSHLKHSLTFGRLVIVYWGSQLVDVILSVAVSHRRNDLHFVWVCSDVAPIPVTISCFFSQSLSDAAVHFESSEYFITHACIVQSHRIMPLNSNSLHFLGKEGKWAKSFSLKGQKAENGRISCHLALRFHHLGSLLQIMKVSALKHKQHNFFALFLLEVLRWVQSQRKESFANNSQVERKRADLRIVASNLTMNPLRF